MRRIIGIGASAGGLEAFKNFFAHMPPDSGMAVVDCTPIAPAQFYLLPPNTTLTVDDSMLWLGDPSAGFKERRQLKGYAYLLKDSGSAHRH